MHAVFFLPEVLRIEEALIKIIKWNGHGIPAQVSWHNFQKLNLRIEVIHLPD